MKTWPFFLLFFAYPSLGTTLLETGAALGIANTLQGTAVSSSKNILDQTQKTLATAQQAENKKAEQMEQITNPNLINKNSPQTRQQVTTNPMAQPVANPIAQAVAKPPAQALPQAEQQRAINSAVNSPAPTLPQNPASQPKAINPSAQPVTNPPAQASPQAKQQTANLKAQPATVKPPTPALPQNPASQPAQNPASQQTANLPTQPATNPPAQALPQASQQTANLPDQPATKLKKIESSPLDIAPSLAKSQDILEDSSLEEDSSLDENLTDLNKEDLDKRFQDEDIYQDVKPVDYRSSIQIFYKRKCNSVEKRCDRGPVLTNIKSVIFDYAHTRGSFSKK